MADTTHYRFVIADDHPLFRGALREAVSGLFKQVEIGEAGYFEDVAALLDRGGDVDLILLDLSMPGRGGLDALKQIRTASTKLPVLVLSQHAEEQYAIRAFRAGASGYVTKDSAPDELVKAMQK